MAQEPLWYAPGAVSKACNSPHGIFNFSLFSPFKFHSKVAAPYCASEKHQISNYRQASHRLPPDTHCTSTSLTSSFYLRRHPPAPSTHIPSKSRPR